MNNEDVMFSIINPVGIIKGHIESLRKSVHFITLMILFLVLPIFTAFILVAILKIYLTENMIDFSLTSLSVFTGLLFSLLFIIYDILNKEKEKLNPNDKKQAEKLELLKQLYANVSFTILLGFSLIFTLLLAELFLRNKFILIASSTLFYIEIALFFLTLLQILKRTHVLLEEEF
ncbi:hypothetical protein [Hydrogenivirga sp. 128-5-R1-1]|uniref:hypothetical protein n=1 Tax=Hydrogenivirga sp. 128-5-R1-1 TaxID=392423 RepID=UPI00015F2EF0|nr:hypothetical protein [Hydrogenivirga sp. 128-5-R1-1]EDP73349.1 hypothetical protein HG1285_11088 [Hydrogenivirga sp. 128-5-R1-1]